MKFPTGYSLIRLKIEHECAFSFPLSRRRAFVDFPIDINQAVPFPAHIITDTFVDRRAKQNRLALASIVKGNRLTLFQSTFVTLKLIIINHFSSFSSQMVHALRQGPETGTRVFGTMFPQCECHTTRHWNIFLIFRFFSKYPGHFCYLDKIMMSAYPSTQHAKRLARAGQGVQYR